MLIAYIHGYLSGPNAIKAQILKRVLSEKYPEHSFISLDFPDIPKEALTALCEFCQNYSQEQLGLVGSSMGGFMATVLSNLYNLKAALVNPCVHPQNFCKELLGPQYNSCTDTHFFLTQEMIDYLKQLDTESHNALNIQNLYILLQKGDEVLDYRQALSYYQNAKIEVFAGGCHAFENFEAVVPQIIDFLTKRS